VYQINLNCAVEKNGWKLGYTPQDELYISKGNSIMKMKKILLLGSGELGKEFVISAKRLGQYVIAVDSYLERIGASAVILAKESSSETPIYTGVADAISMPKTDIRIFGKPTTRPYRRMAVALSYDGLNGDLTQVRKSAIENAKRVHVN
jgi:formate-dependent phosphoribosylglycinamide formyltransferase (GAR transformylase)